MKPQTVAVIVLGLIALATVIGGIYLAASDHSLPEAVIAIGSASAGAVGGILVEKPSGGSDGG